MTEREKKRKLAAAMAAVAAYMQGEQEALSAGPRQPADRSSARVRPWAAGGRADQMNLRQLMQLRTFPKIN